MKVDDIVGLVVEPLSDHVLFFWCGNEQLELLSVEFNLVVKLDKLLQTELVRLVLLAEAFVSNCQWRIHFIDQEVKPRSERKF